MITTEFHSINSKLVFNLGIDIIVKSRKHYEYSSKAVNLSIFIDRLAYLQLPLKDAEEHGRTLKSITL